MHYDLKKNQKKSACPCLGSVSKPKMTNLAGPRFQISRFKRRGRRLLTGGSWRRSRPSSSPTDRLRAPRSRAQVRGHHRRRKGDGEGREENLGEEGSGRKAAGEGRCVTDGGDGRPGARAPPPPASREVIPPVPRLNISGMRWNGMRRVGGRAGGEERRARPPSASVASWTLNQPDPFSCWVCVSLFYQV